MDLIYIWSGVWEDKSVIHMSVCMRAFAVGMVVLSLGVPGLALGSESGIFSRVRLTEKGS